MRTMIGWMTISMMATGALGCGGDSSSDMYAYESGRPAVDGDVHDGENYGELIENDWIAAETEATSTFSIDVDNGSYTLMRRDLTNGILPAKDGVRTEEYLNFFDYDYPQPTDGEPFSIHMEIAPSEFGEDLHMLRIGLQGLEIPREDLKPANLVFLIDTSGSMTSEQKLPLVQQSLNSLVDNLRPTDTIGIVTYAGNAGVLLQPTPVSDASRIKAAVDSLSAGGSTNGEGGIVAAYELAEQAKIEGGTNRVILATDGDMNVGRTGDDLIALISEYREKHISLTTIGFGSGNYNDYLMEGLAREGNGNYFYIDSIAEAQRIFGDDLASTLEVIAADVKIQVEFDATNVVRYRLVGYENRLLDNEDFDDDTKDAGEIGPGHTVTALYEIEIAAESESESGLLADVRLRHKEQYGSQSRLQEQSIKMSQVKSSFEDASPGLQFAMAVTEFAEILRDSKHSDGMRIDDVITIASANADDDAKSEFVELATTARDLLPR